MRRRIALAALAVAALGLAALPSFAAEGDENSAALAKALAQAKVSLERGLKASAREGKPISGKYEIEDGALQLSIYTAKRGQFSEIIVDHTSGTIKKKEKITDGDDLKDAKEQSQAMAKAKISLDNAVARAVKANRGYRAVGVVPVLEDAKPVAEVTLVKGEAFKKVLQKLD
ncbi:MAG TPA: hypothetical protein VN668_11070 [Stellaceae bacterium]|nr:hypothetical protein [Stellaceae bacterium]